MKDDGTMARMDDLVAFARLHDLKMGTIRDLIAYRIHSISIFSDLLGQPGPRKRTLQRSMGEIGKAGAGLVVLLMPNDPDSLSHEIGGKPRPEMDLRNYGIGAQILADLGVHDMTLLTNAHRNVVAIEGYGLNIVGEQPIPEA